MAIYKRCSRCGKRLNVGAVCECCIPKGKATNIQTEAKRQKAYDETKRNKVSARFYNSAVWHKLRERAKAYYKSIDIYSYYVYDNLEFGRIVHHIRPIKTYPHLKDKVDNLIYLTEKNHQMIHKRLETEDSETVMQELEALVERYRNDFLQG